MLHNTLVCVTNNEYLYTVCNLFVCWVDVRFAAPSTTNFASKGSVFIICPVLYSLKSHLEIDITSGVGYCGPVHRAGFVISKAR